MAARLVAAARRGRLHGDGVARPCSSSPRSTKSRCSSIATEPDAIRSPRGTKEAPYAYVVPQEQRDPVAAVELLRRLAFGGVRVFQLTDAATFDGASYPAGTWIVPTDQEFAAMAREVLDVQKYPDLRQYPGGPPERPYDAAGWTLPLQMGVKVVAGCDAADRRDARAR